MTETVYKPGDKVWTLNKDFRFEERVVQTVASYHVGTDLLEGEPTSDPKTGMFIGSHHHLKLEVGHTQLEMIQNRMFLEAQRINCAANDIKRAKERIAGYEGMRAKILDPLFKPITL